MRKIMLLLVFLVAVLTATAEKSQYGMCSNRTIDFVSADGDSMRFNNSLGFWLLSNPDKTILFHKLRDGNNSFNITLDARITADTTGFAINRSSYSNRYFWVLENGNNMTYKINASGNITQKINLSQTGIVDASSIDTIDGSRLYILDKDLGRIFEIDNNSVVYSTIDLSRVVNPNAEEFALVLNRSSIREIVTMDTVSKNFGRYNAKGELLQTLNYLSFGEQNLGVVETFDNSTFWTLSTSLDFILNITKDVTVPRVFTPSFNQTEYKAGETMNISVRIDDDCALDKAWIQSNFSYVMKNYSYGSTLINLDSNDTGTKTYTIQFTNNSICSRSFSIQVVANDSAANTNISTINVTIALPTFNQLGTNGSTDINCTASSFSNLTYQFSQNIWMNFSVNMSQQFNGTDVICAYSAEGVELANISNITGYCKVRGINRFTNGSSIVRIFSYAGLSTSPTTNIPLAFAASAIASIIIAVAIARTRRN